MSMALPLRRSAIHFKEEFYLRLVDAITRYALATDRRATSACYQDKSWPNPYYIYQVYVLMIHN